MRTAIRASEKRKCLSLRELRESYLEQGKIMSGPFKHIDSTHRQDRFGGYYNAVDFTGRAWKITQFSLSGIWVMWPPESSKRPPIYAYSLWDADVILGGGVVKDQKISKPERVSPIKAENQGYYENKADYQIDQARQQLEQKQFEQRKIRRSSIPEQFSIR